MRVLIVIGGCITVNSSANLCHNAYIKGFIDRKDDVIVISMSDRGQIVDSSISLPKGAKYIMFDSSFLLKFINPSTRSNLNNKMENKDRTFKVVLFSKIRSLILKSFGVFGYSQVWINNTVRKFKDNQEYDLVLSLSSPVTGHVAAHKLISKNKIKCKNFCELWEDPWQYDLYKDSVNEELLSLEYDITKYSDKVLYVSPITLEIQKSIFSLSSQNMDWVPLPYYYKDTGELPNYSKHIYGYFGDYFPHVRNLEPFFNISKEMKLNVEICGMPNELFNASQSIHIHPRLPLKELKKYEESVNVLVFVCNLKGGQIPGKIYQYSATRKKILFILDGTIEEKKIIVRYFEKFNRYYFCDNNMEEIKKAIIRLEADDNYVENNYIEYFSPYNIANLIVEKVCLNEEEVEK